MTDTITESFCERCGTRYAFERAASRRRGGLGGVRVLTRGLKNYVANDGLPMSEAMAAARIEEGRSQVTQQLDAFHKAFNFCMSCRQYTCASCWNEKAGECLTCAPDLSREVLPAPFPDLPAGGPLAAGNGHDAHEKVESTAWPRVDLDRQPGFAPIATTVALDGAAESHPVAPVEVPEALAPASSPTAAGASTDELTAGELAEIESVLSATRAQPTPETAAAQPSPATGPAEAVEPPIPEAAPVDRVAETRKQTRGLLARFRPGRPAPEATHAATEAPAPAVAVPSQSHAAPGPDLALEQAAAAAALVAAAGAEPEAVEVAPEATPEPAALVAAAAAKAAAVEAAPEALEPVAELEVAEIAPQAALEALEVEPEAAAAAEAAPIEAAPTAPTDVVEQPTWRVVAPDAGPAPTPGAPPAWPETPGWPSAPRAPRPPAGPASAAWASRLATARPAADGIWAASNREVLGSVGVPDAPSAGPAVQACVSCGLSLSATARFCRRCGTRQG